MAKKQAEGSFVDLANFYNYFHHKYGDVRACPHCHKNLPKSENAPDYAAGIVYTYVECKNSNASSHGIWKWTELLPDGARANQRKWLETNGGWLFIVLGIGRAPKGKSAYLLPFEIWSQVVEPYLLSKEMRSIRRETIGDRKGADEFLADYRLEWKPNEGWVIPDGHIWWLSLRVRLESQLDFIKHKLERKGTGHTYEQLDFTQSLPRTQSQRRRSAGHEKGDRSRGGDSQGHHLKRGSHRNLDDPAVLLVSPDPQGDQRSQNGASDRAGSSQVHGD